MENMNKSHKLILVIVLSIVIFFICSLTITDIKEIIGGFMSVIIIFVVGFLFILIKNIIKGNKWNHIDDDNSPILK